MPNTSPNLLFAYLNGCKKMLKETTFKLKCQESNLNFNHLLKVVIEFISPHIICILLSPRTPKVTPNHQNVIMVIYVSILLCLHLQQKNLICVFCGGR